MANIIVCKCSHIEVQITALFLYKPYFLRRQYEDIRITALFSLKNLKPIFEYGCNRRGKYEQQLNNFLSHFTVLCNLTSQQIGAVVLNPFSCRVLLHNLNSMNLASPQLRTAIVLLHFTSVVLNGGAGARWNCITCLVWRHIRKQCRQEWCSSLH